MLWLCCYFQTVSERSSLNFSCGNWCLILVQRAVCQPPSHHLCLLSGGALRLQNERGEEISAAFSLRWGSCQAGPVCSVWHRTVSDRMLSWKAPPPTHTSTTWEALISPGVDTFSRTLASRPPPTPPSSLILPLSPLSLGPVLMYYGVIDPFILDFPHESYIGESFGSLGFPMNFTEECEISSGSESSFLIRRHTFELSRRKLSETFSLFNVTKPQGLCILSHFYSVMYSCCTNTFLTLPLLYRTKSCYSGCMLTSFSYEVSTPWLRFVYFPHFSGGHRRCSRQGHHVPSCGSRYR